MKKSLLCLTLATAITSVGMPLRAHGEETAESAKKRYDEAVAQYNLGSAGFFQYLGNKGDEDAKQAYKIITATDNSLQDGAKSTVDYSVYTHLGVADDATNLENMKKAVDELNMVNEYRKKENDTRGTSLADLQVTSTLMAISQYQLNYSKAVIEHSQAFNVAENLAWGSTNPFMGWYDEEKALYDGGNHTFEDVGHYLNVVNDSYTVMGYSYVSGSNVTYGRAYGQTFGSTASGFSKTAVVSMSVADYQAKFNAYYNEVKNELAEAEKALKDAGGNVPDQDETISKPDNSGSDNSAASNAETNTDTIKNTAEGASGIALITLMLCGVAFVAMLGKKRKA